MLRFINSNEYIQNIQNLQEDTELMQEYIQFQIFKYSTTFYVRTEQCTHTTKLYQLVIICFDNHNFLNIYLAFSIRTKSFTTYHGLQSELFLVTKSTISCIQYLLIAKYFTVARGRSDSHNNLHIHLSTSHDHLLLGADLTATTTCTFNWRLAMITCYQGLI